MAKISLSPKFIKEVIWLFRERPIKEVLFGKHVELDDREAELLQWILEHQEEFRRVGGRKGILGKVDPIHKGVGTVYVLPNRLGDEKKETLILFSADTKITNGPDLWVYLSSSRDVTVEGLGENMRLVLLKGNQGGQSYVVKATITEAAKYYSVVIWCKQFSVLFSFAPLH